MSTQQKLILLELNEVNFEFAERYAARGLLPNLARLFERHGIARTTSEVRYEHLEPWIQWVTAHTGLTLAQHGVFRLGDIVDRDLEQIWEVLERRGLKIGAICPMNAKNRTRNAAFFLPDPWTRTPVTGGKLLARLSDAISQMVNDNAQARFSPKSVAWLLAGLIAFARPRNYLDYVKLVFNAARGKGWAKAQFLEQLIADIAIRQIRRDQPDFVSIFMNAGAHIQHHYMFNAKVYDGGLTNPEWLVSRQDDPVFEIYKQYDDIVGDLRAECPDYRLIIASGLHQDPYPETTYYWRLKDHEAFLRHAGIDFASVEPRMSRDFLIAFEASAAADEAEARLARLRTANGVRLFAIDNRGDSLFVTLTYPGDIADDLRVFDGDRDLGSLKPHVAFVAIKNGEHNGVGYLIDTGAAAADEPEIALAALPNRIARHFGFEWNATHPEPLREAA